MPVPGDFDDLLPGVLTGEKPDRRAPDLQRFSHCPEHCFIACALQRTCGDPDVQDLALPLDLAASGTRVSPNRNSNRRRLGNASCSAI